MSNREEFADYLRAMHHKRKDVLPPEDLIVLEQAGDALRQVGPELESLKVTSAAAIRWAEKERERADATEADLTKLREWYDKLVAKSNEHIDKLAAAEAENKRLRGALEEIKTAGTLSVFGIACDALEGK